MIDLTQVVIAAIGLATVVLTIVIFPYVKQKVSSEKLTEIQTWVSIAVRAAEMIFVGTGRGEEKKAYVVEFLNSKGFTIDMASIDAMIESAVLTLKNAI